MRIVSKLRMAPKRVSAIIAIAAAVVTVPAALLAWGPSRETYTIEQPADHVVFNSITNNPAHGDERNFVQVKTAGASDSTYSEKAQLVPGKQYTVFVYYHNNAASNLNASGKGIAKDVKARVEIPAVVAKGSTGTKAVGYIDSSNASPKTVWDDISFANSTAGDIALRYVAGSAKIHNQGKSNGAKVADSIVSSGAALGYDSLNGVVPGCEQYAGYVTFNVQADQPNFDVSKQVRKLGETSKDWRESATVNAGDKVEYLIHYKNTGTTQQNNVVVKDQLPSGVSYVAGTTKVMNALNPSGKTISDNVVTSTGVNISNYTPGSDAYVWFTAQVKAKSQLECGTNTLVNKAIVSTNNGSKSDTANIVVTGDKCVEPKDIEVCELATKKIITIKETEFDSSKHSKNLDDCKEVVKNIEVCELETKRIVVIDEKDFDSSKYSKNLADCEEKPVTEKIKVCELETKKIVTIDEDMFDAKKYSKDLADCEEVPVTPTELPKTGPAEVVAKLAGALSLASASAYYVASRRSN